MRIDKIFIEQQVQQHPQTQRIISAFPKSPIHEIAKVEDVFERARKPYLQKRDSLNLFIGKKEGQLVKPAPEAYGVSGEPHYYFVHAYNCIYECEYCYLQGYFQSPDLVMFVNHDEIISEIRTVAGAHSANETVWFHAGEFSDSLALSHITREWDQYWDAFAEMPNAKLELRTKSVNIKSIMDLQPIENIVLTYSMSPAEASRKYDRKTPSLSARMKALTALAERKFRLGLHLDPIVYTENFAIDYRDMMSEIAKNIPESLIEYISLGVVRFSKDSYLEFSRNYPESELLAAEFVKGMDGKVRYNRPMRLHILHTVRQICIEAGIQSHKVYLCMEDEPASSAGAIAPAAFNR